MASRAAGAGTVPVSGKTLLILLRREIRFGLSRLIRAWPARNAAIRPRLTGYGSSRGSALRSCERRSALAPRQTAGSLFHCSVSPPRRGSRWSSQATATLAKPRSTVPGVMLALVGADRFSGHGRRRLTPGLTRWGWLVGLGWGRLRPLWGRERLCSGRPRLRAGVGRRRDPGCGSGERGNGAEALERGEELCIPWPPGRHAECHLSCGAGDATRDAQQPAAECPGGRDDRVG
jgi:hypothetical protein